jgi:hypothetical protein
MGEISTLCLGEDGSVSKNVRKVQNLENGWIDEK